MGYRMFSGMLQDSLNHVHGRSKAHLIWDPHFGSRCRKHAETHEIKFCEQTKEASKNKEGEKSSKSFYDMKPSQKCN
jgi:hypothetical protein